MGENGLIRQAEKTGEHHANGVASEQDAIDSLLDKYLNGISGEENSGTPENPTVAVTGVTLDKTNETLASNGTLQLTATVAPSEASNKNVTWTSSTPSVATVSQTGLVTAVSAGSTTITVTTEDGGKTASCSVTVEIPKPLTSTVTSTNHEGTATKDTLGNLVYIPGGFKIASDSGSTVKDGIVIEDGSGNQFVWIPVSNIDHGGSNKIKIDATNEVEITLGRYTFATSSPGTETKVQYASEYAETTLSAVTEAEEAKKGDVLSYRIGSYYYELTDFREANQVQDTKGTNATAKYLEGFINSVNTNKGYYLARYEASYASGSTFGVGDNSTYYKPASKVSTSNSTSSMKYKTGTLWNFITQGNASKACRQMYYGNSYVESDLVNSYAWDTAIVYIQAMGNTNYANQGRGNNTTLLNTGSTGDEVCKIFDMAGNVNEYTTECDVKKDTYYAYPFTCRGSRYDLSTGCTSSRFGGSAISSKEYLSFRPLIYIKEGVNV